MNRKWMLSITLVLGLLAVTATIALSWSEVDPTTGAGPDFMVSLPLDHQADPSVAYNSNDDEYLVVWWDNRGNDTDIYGQLFSSSGIPQGDNFVVSGATDEQSYPYVAYNSTDHDYMVVWRDKRGGAGYDVYGQVISNTGVLSGTNFAVNTDADDQKPWDLIYDPNANHYLTVWVDAGDEWVEGQLLSPAGGLIGTNAFTVTNAGGDRPHTAYDSERNSYLVVYQQGTTGNRDIYGQAIAGDGSLSGAAFPICTDAADQVSPNLEFNSSTHEYLVAWQDYRNDATTGADIYARRIDQDGAAQGSEIVITNATDAQNAPDVAYNSRINQWLVAWEDYRDRNSSGVDIYGQRVLSTGSLAGQGNFSIYDGPNNQGSVALAARPTTTGAEYLAAWEDQRSGDGLEVIGQRIGALLGTLNWHDFNISAPLESQEHPRVIYNPTDQQFLVVWQDERDGNADIYAQIVLTSGIPITDNIVVRDDTNALVNPVVAYNSADRNYLVVWEDQDYGNIEAGLLNAAGTVSLVMNNYNGVPTSTHPAIAYNTTANQYMVVFASQAGVGNYDIYGRLVETDGLPSGATPFTISVDTADQSLPQVSYNATDDEYLVVWSDERADQGDVYGRRVDADGSLLGSEFLIAHDTDAQDAPSVAWNEDDNEYLVIWHDYRDSGTSGADIYGQRVQADGSLSGSEIALCTASEDQQYPHVRYSAAYGRYFVLWQDNRNASTSWDIYGQNVNGDGSLYGSNVARFTFSGDQRWPDGDFSPEANRGLTVWQDGRNGATYKVYGRIKEPRFAIYLPLVLRNS
ncbi:MAG: hypothetical protein DRJ03_26845 [Chloroflexi bacterium]|nr:MAG: hypothetical protein DRI81_15145 [Chloroflexota bacterium]RLC77444.1 MAG: hypothetical protein DRJ03_26845 [Chloroflexota bacterium]